MPVTLPLAGAGTYWRQAKGEYDASNHDGTIAGLAAAKAALAPGGILQQGPGLEAIPIGVMPAGVGLFQVLNGQLGLSRFAVLDGTDPTKTMIFDASGIGTGANRTAFLPNWSGVVLLPPTLGNLDEFLRSGGAGIQPGFASIAQALLGGRHTDTVAAAVAAGALIFGNATPKWDVLLKDLDGMVLTLVAGLPKWSAASATLLEHNALFHIRPIQVANCAIANASDRLTTGTANGFANVRVGDFVRFDIMTTSVWGARVIALDSTTQVQLNLTNTGSSQSGRTATFTPGDHWDDTLVTGYMLACGRGTYDAAATPGGTLQEIRGPLNWEGYEGGHAPDFRVWGSTSLANPFGFALRKPGTGSYVYFHVNDLTGAKTIRLGDPASGSFLTYQNGSSQAVFDSSGLSATRSLIVRDYAGTVAVDGAVTVLTGATPSVAGGRTFKVSNIGATNMTNLTGSYDGLEVTLLFTNGNTTVKDTSTTGSFELALSVDFNPLANTIMKFVRVNADAKWYEVSRSVN